MYMVPLMFMGMFMHVHACSCMLNSGCPHRRGEERFQAIEANANISRPISTPLRRTEQALIDIENGSNTRIHMITPMKLLTR